MRIMTTEFDWFMVTMPIFALIVWAIVMVGSMEKQPKFLDGVMAKKLFGVVFVGFFFWSDCGIVWNRRILELGAAHQLLDASHALFFIFLFRNPPR